MSEGPTSDRRNPSQGRRATDAGNFPKLTAAVLVMAIVVVGINRTLWKKLQVVADNRCRFGL